MRSGLIWCAAACRVACMKLSHFVGLASAIVGLLLAVAAAVGALLGLALRHWW